MKNQQCLSLTPIFLAMALNVISLNAYADDEHNHGDDAHYVYTNDGQATNTVTGFKVARNGSLTKIGQWPTGGTGCSHGLIATTRATASKNGDLLFVSNGFGVGTQLTNGTCPSVAATISVFRGASHGNLSLVKVISDPANLTPGDTSVASFGNCLILGSTNGKKLISYKLPAVTLVSTLPLGYPLGDNTIDDMKINKVGKTRYAAATLVNDNQIAVTRINSDTCELGTQTIIATAGLEVGILGGSAGLGFSPDGRKMYVGDSNYDPILDKSTTIVEAFDFPSGTPLAGSPYSYLSGENSNTVLVSKDGKCLFVANQNSATVTSIPLSSGVPGSSFITNPVGIWTGSPLDLLTTGMANDIDGKMLYVGIRWDNFVDGIYAGDNTVSTELIGTDCALTGVPGGAVPTGVSPDDGFMTSIVATGGDGTQSK